MNSSKFVADFIVECAQKDITSAKEICTEAELQIKILNEEIGKAQKLKIKRSNLQSVIRQLSEPKSKEDKQNRLRVDFTLPIEEQPAELRKMCSMVCNYVSENPDKKPNEIIESVASYLESDTVYLAIKCLGYHSIINQVSSGQARVVCKGSNWNDRPVYEDNQS